MTKYISPKKLFLLTIIFGMILYLFWGPLFPWNPIKNGYKKIPSSMATVYITEFEGEDVVNRIDQILQEGKEFHGFEFHKKFRIVVLGKESNMKRFLPWLKGSGYSTSLGSINVIYIGPIARNSPYGIEVFLKHEISHMLIQQNVSSAKNNMLIMKQGWLAEGIATYFGGPHYYNKNEFRELWTSNGLTFDSLFEDNPHKMDRNLIRLEYTYYRFFIEYLIDAYGMERLRSYLKRYVDNPRNYKEIFPEIYNEDLDEILGEFETYMDT